MPVIKLAPPDTWPTLGWGVIAWIERYLCHGPGDVAGDPIDLDDEQSQFILDCYRIYPKGHRRVGRRVVDEAEFSRPKGRAKSELLGMIACAELAGPVRFLRWEKDGTPVGRPVKDPVIRCLATEEGQTGEVYNNIFDMLGHAQEHFPALFDDLDVGKTRVVVKGRRGVGVFPLSAGAKSKDGGKPTFIAIDESHLYDSPELHSLYNTEKRNLRKRKEAEPWSCTGTTQFLPGAGSVAEINRDEAEGQHCGQRKRRLEFCWDHREGHPVENWDDDKEVLASLREAYGVFAQVMDLDGVLAQVRDPHTTRADAERYFLNRRAQGAGKAVDPLQWDALADHGRGLPSPGATVVLCFDGSKSRDSTALLGYEVGDKPHLFAVKVWERPPDAPVDWQVPKDQVDGEVHAAFGCWRVARLVYDPPYWREHANAWANEFGEDIVIAFETNKGPKMGPAIERFLDEAIPDGNFTHDGDLVLRRHVLNALRAKTRGGHAAVVKEKDLKIDALVAAIIGYEELQYVEIVAPIDIAANVW